MLTPTYWSRCGGDDILYGVSVWPLLAIWVVCFFCEYGCVGSRELAYTGTCTVRCVRCEAEWNGRYVVVWYWRCGRCGAGTVSVR